PGLRVRSRR
ncbi:NAD regulator, partial [Bradyrhizobium sp. CCBAU 21359]|nr:NAD regulator [Bradyrhizobium sp. CCBAU 21359]